MGLPEDKIIRKGHINNKHNEYINGISTYTAESYSIDLVDSISQLHHIETLYNYISDPRNGLTSGVIADYQDNEYTLTVSGLNELIFNIRSNIYDAHIKKRVKNRDIDDCITSSGVCLIDWD
jgi:hypothetical protein